MPGFLERLHTLWAALRLRLRGGAPGLFYIGGSDTMPAPLDRAAEQQAIRALAAGSEGAASLLIEHNLRLPLLMFFPPSSVLFVMEMEQTFGSESVSMTPVGKTKAE